MDDQGSQQHVTGSPIPSDEEGRRYAVSTKLLSTVDHTQVVYIRFLEYGPRYLMVRGSDQEGRERIIWLTGHPSVNGIRVVAETTTDGFLSEDRVQELANEHGEIQELFLAPNDRLEGVGKNKPVWFVKLKDKSVIYVDPISGRKLK